MLSYEDALAKTLDGVAPLEPERIPLVLGAGRVLAETVVAERALPEFDHSAMDGYAVDSGSFPEGTPASLLVVGESRAGAPPGLLAPRSACRIFTGAPIPKGADAVVMQEDTARDGDRVRIDVRPRAGANVRRAGEDLARGTIAFEPGTRLSPYKLGLLAALGRSSILVGRRPRVTILCTGDELLAPGEVGPPGSIPESNGVVVAALAAQAGASPELAPLMKDSPDRLKTALGRLLATNDLVVTIGGVSVGDYDFVKQALLEAGGRVDYHKVAIKPGKPLLSGRAGQSRLLGLPGNPTSAAVTFTLFGIPLIRKLQGDQRSEHRFEKRALASDFRQRAGRRGFYACRLDGDSAAPLGHQASGAPTVAAFGDGLFTLAANVEHAPAGSQVDTLPFSGLGF